MKKRFFFVFGVLLILAGLFLIVRIAAQAIFPKGKGALQVSANIKADVSLNGKHIGQTNLCICDQNKTIAEGEYDLKISPSDSSLPPFITKVKIFPGVLTAVERTFLPGSFASSYVLTLEKTGEKDASLLVSSIPDGALVTTNGNQVGATSYFQKSIPTSEHEIEIQKQGYGKKTLRVRAVAGYKLVINTMLGTDGGEDEALTTPTPAPQSVASSSAQIKIKKTPNNFLNVRKDPSVDSEIVIKAHDDETYPLLSEKEGWFEIKLTDGTSGWISSTYSEKIE